MLRVVEELDHIIREELGACDENAGEMKVQITHTPPLGMPISERDASAESTIQPPAPLTKQVRERLKKIKQTIDPNGAYVGESDAILRVFAGIETFNKDSSDPVLIVGPTGAGKTVLARLIHDSSGRVKANYISVQATDVTGQDEQIIRAQWSGIGQDSGLSNVAKKGTRGYLQDNAGGTIFIDEVAELPAWFQTYLLRVLDCQEIRPASGQREPFIPNVRLILATNADLAAKVTDGSFRNDLYQRISSRIVTIPPLKERKEDIVPFVQQECGKRTVTPEFILALMRYDWEKGNVRELLATIRQAIARTNREQEPITRELIPDFPTFAEIRALGTEQCEVEVYRILHEIFEAQGVEKGKGLHKQIAKTLGFSQPWVSALAKRAAQQ